MNATIGLGRDLSILVEVFPGTSAIGIGTSAAEDGAPDVTKRA